MALVEEYMALLTIDQADAVERILRAVAPFLCCQPMTRGMGHCWPECQGPERAELVAAVDALKALMNQGGLDGPNT